MRDPNPQNAWKKPLSAMIYEEARSFQLRMRLMGLVRSEGDLSKPEVKAIMREMKVVTPIVLKRKELRKQAGLKGYRERQAKGKKS